MLRILHKGIQASFDLDQTGLTGDTEADSKLAYIQSLKGGRLAAIGANGVKLADGATDTPLGFIINDAEGYFYENKPALASGKVPLTVGDQIVVTDQIDTSEVFAKGDKLYAGTGAKVGLVTKTAPAAGAKVIGIATSTASAASPELTIVVA